MKQPAEYRIGVGASSILMVLVVLALTALSLLSFGSAKNNATLSKRNLSMTLAYYQAAAQAQEKLAMVDALMAENAAKLPDAQALSMLLIRHGITDIALTESLHFSFDVDAGAQRVLTVDGTLSPASFPRYAVTGHQLANHATLQEQPLNVFQP